MARTRLDEKTLRDNPVGELILQLIDSVRTQSALRKNLEECFVTSLDRQEPVLDPFRARTLISAVEADAVVCRLLALDARSQLKAHINSECIRLANSFEARLRSFCNQRQIDVQGRFPKYLLSGFLEVSVDEAKHVCKIDGKKVMSLMLESIAPTILEVLSQEEARPFDVGSFGMELYEAYERVLRIRGLGKGEPVQILGVFREIVFVKQTASFYRNPTKRNYSEYSRENFARDLARFCQVDPVAGRKRLQLMPTAFAQRDGLPIRTGSTMRYIGSLAFSEVSSS